MKPDICIYHGNCADGFTAAWAVWKRFGGDVEYVPGAYGSPPPDCAGKTVLVVDFSYKRDVMLEMAKRANGVLVLDHHKTAKDDLEADGNYIVDMTTYSGNLTWQRFLDNCFQDRCEGVPYGRVYTVFDMERSGAGITWDFLHPGRSRPRLVDYVEDRDLWRFDLRRSRDASAYIFAHEYTFENWQGLAEDFAKTPDAAFEAGAAIEKKHHKDVAELVAASKRPMVIGGHSVEVANVPYTLSSDAGHLLTQTNAFGACYFDTPKGRVFSLRSVDEKEDVGAIAKSYGGGGHRNASGFTMPHGWEGDA